LLTSPKSRESLPVLNPNHPIEKTFAVDAGKALFKHRKVVAQDVADFKDAKVAEDFLLAGMKIGEIGRIAVWGSPAE
jgi:hypothetical protein